MSVITCRSYLSHNVPVFSEPRSPVELFSCLGGTTGSWKVTNLKTRCGMPLKPASRVEIVNGHLDRVPSGTAWVLSGIVSNSRYVTREDPGSFEPNGYACHTAEPSCAVLIPTRKSAEWWRLARDERREIMEARSRRLIAALKYLPKVARRLRQGRDVGEKFDFVTWFEYAPQDTKIIDEMVSALRATEEWQYVEREVDIRLVRDGATGQTRDESF